MTYKFRDRDIDEIWADTATMTLHINYIGSTGSTFYTRKDLLRMLDIVDGIEQGVVRK